MVYVVSTVKTGDRVTLCFALSLSDGTLVDSASQDDPITLTLGQNELINGLEQRLLGLAIGAKHRFEIEKIDAYGSAQEPILQPFSPADFPPELDLKINTVLAFGLPNGEEIPGTIVAINDAEIVVDFSHPLAGHDLIFEVEICAINPD